MFKEGFFKGNYEGIPAVKIDDWLVNKIEVSEMRG